MIISFIKTQDYIYFNLHAEEVITSNYLKDDNQGVYIPSLQFETINRLYNFIKGKTLTSQSKIVFDFELYFILYFFYLIFVFSLNKLLYCYIIILTFLDEGRLIYVYGL